MRQVGHKPNRILSAYRVEMKSVSVTINFKVDVKEGLYKSAVQRAIKEAPRCFNSLFTDVDLMSLTVHAAAYDINFRKDE